jgi:hypothetical protein
MTLDKKTNSIWRKMGMVACSGLLAFNMACGKYERNSPTHTKVHTQKYVLQPVDFDVLYQNGNIYEAYRHVTYEQSKEMCISIPPKGIIELRSESNYPECVIDMMISKFVEGELQPIINPKTNSRVFKKSIYTSSLVLKPSANLYIYYLLEPIKHDGKLPKQIESIGIRGKIIGEIPNKPCEPEPKPRRERTVRIYEPVEERLEPSPVQVIYIQKEYVNARPAGGFGFFFGFSSVRRYPVGGCAPYPIMEMGCVPYGPPMNYCPPPSHNRPIMQRNHVIRRSSLAAPNVQRAHPVTRSSLQQRNVRSAPARSAQIRRR